WSRAWRDQGLRRQSKYDYCAVQRGPACCVGTLPRYHAFTQWARGRAPHRGICTLTAKVLAGPITKPGPSRDRNRLRVATDTTTWRTRPRHLCMYERVSVM